MPADLKPDSLDNYSGVFHLTYVHKYMQREFAASEDVTWRGFEFKSNGTKDPIGNMYTQKGKTVLWNFLNMWQNYSYQSLMNCIKSTKKKQNQKKCKQFLHSGCG